MTNLPKLDFLYFNLEHTEENYLDRKELYYDKVDWDERHFEDYAKTCSFEELVYLMIYIYKEKYPRDKFESIISLDSKDQILRSYTDKKGRIITDKKYDFYNFLRKEVIGMISQFHIEEYTDEEIIEKYWRSEGYMQHLYLEFNKEVPIHIIEKALEGKEYTKTERNHILLYELENSPIASLEITKTSIKLNINEDRVILYVSIW